MAERQTAPKVRTKSQFKDRRAELKERLDREHPEFFHTFRNSRVTADDLRVSGQELVTEATYDPKGDAGKPVRWRNDLVARMPKKAHDEMRAEKTEEHASEVEELYRRKSGGNEEEWKPNSAGRRVAQAKRTEDIQR